MSHPSEGEVFVARLEITGPSPAAPPGRYISVGIGRGPQRTRAFLSDAQALELGKWLCRPKARKPADRIQSPTSFPVVSVQDLGPMVELVPPQDDTAELIEPILDDPVAAPAGDHLVSELFVTGLRERWSGRPTADLERELATFEPMLVRAAKRLIRGAVARHIGPAASCCDVIGEACFREVVVLLLSLRGAYGDLWYGVFGNTPGEAESDA